MYINPDFRTRLRQRAGSYVERFDLLRAGGYWMSIQLPEERLLDLRSIRGLEDCDRWRVAILGADGIAATPSTHPRIFQNTLWRRYWIDSLQAPSVPTEVVQTLYDFLVLGADRYEKMTRMQ